MNKIITTLIMKQFILSILFSVLFLTASSCKKVPEEKKNYLVYKTTDKPGYCYTDGYVWYVFYMNSSGSYNYAGTSSNFRNYDSSTIVSWTPTAETVSNYSDNASAFDNASAQISESTGEYSGGYDANAESSDSGGGISEATGEDAGGSESSSDSGSGDSGGGDSGGGDGGGGGD
jgi:hypothetical protein